MKPYFVDTVYFVALRNSRDQAHAAAKAATIKLGKRGLVTTAWVLTEVANFLAAPASRPGFAELVRLFASRPQWQVVPPTPELFERGIDYYNRRTDKEWSLTDCISFIVMEDLGLAEVLTTDHHIEQACFVALLR